MNKLIILFLLPVQLAFAQREIHLEDCYKQARENYPNLQQAGLWKEISALKKENLATGWLPQVNMNLQSTWQSDVIRLDISLPQISIPTVPKDQYKAYVDFTQTLWDGGMTAANARLEDALLQRNLDQLEVELYRLNEQVSQAFFAILTAEKQTEVLNAQKKVITEKLKSVESAIIHGMTEKSAALQLRAEILNLEQNELHLGGIKNAALEMLSILTGRSVDPEAEFTCHDAEPFPPQNLSRPELQLFSSQISQMESQMELLRKSRNPKLFGFGQAGFGRPGLNMLNDEFDSYYLVGMGLSWHIFDWNKTNRQKNVVLLQQEMVKKQEDTFNRQVQILLAQQFEQIQKLEGILKTDKKLVSLRSEITAQSASKLANETLTAAGYIQDLQAETVAKLNHELHKIQLSEAKEKYNQISGKTNHNDTGHEH